MRLRPRDPLFELALARWAETAPQMQLDPDDFQARLLWKKEDAGRRRVVVHLSGAGQSFVIKCHFDERDNDRARGSLEAQHAASEQLRHHPRAHAPDVRFISPDDLFSVMAFAEGKTLDTHLAKGKPAAPLLRRSGAWLDAFHRSGQDSERIYQPRFMVRHAARLAKGVQDGAVTVAKPELFLSCANAIPRIAEGFEGRKTVSSTKHGDFNLRNILLGPEGETALDFHPHQTAPVGFDIVRHLLDYAELYGGGDLIPGTLLPSDATRGFFKGYSLIGLDDPGVGFLPFVQILTDWRAIPADPDKQSWRQAARLSGILRLVPQGFSDWI